MGTESSHQERGNYDEILMQHRKTFTDSLKELKNLRKQLYSAAEYFEVSYGKDEHKQELVDTMKVYVSKAVISTVDHLGSVAAKLDTFLDEKVGEFSATKLQFSCIEQRSRSCQEFMDINGVEQQSFVTVFPKYLKHYINPGSDEDTVSDLGKSNRRTPMMTILYPLDDMHQNQRQQDSKGKQFISPLRFQLKRSESYIPKSLSSSACSKQQCPPQPRRTISMPIKPAKATSQNMQLQSNKSKRTLKSLLSLQFTD